MLFEDDLLYLTLKTIIGVLTTIGMMTATSRFRYSLRRLLVVGALYLLYVSISTMILIRLLTWCGFLRIFLLSVSVPGMILICLLARGRFSQSIFNYMTQLNISCFLLIVQALLTGLLRLGKWQDLLLRILVGSAVILLEYRLIRRPFLELTDALTDSWLTMSLMPLSFFILLAFAALYPVHYMESPSQTILLFVIAAVTAVVYAIVFQSFSKGLRLLTMEMEKANLEQLLHTQMRFYSEKLGNEEELRALRHDMRAHLLTLTSLVKEGRTGEAAEYLFRLTEQTQELTDENFCENPYMNIVLRSFSARLRRENIPFQSRIGVRDRQLPGMEVCLILNNALENALEASLLLPPAERSVKVQAAVRKNQLLLRVSNRFRGTLTRQDGCELPATTKTGEGHGYGMANIRSTARRLGGDMLYYAEDGYFVLDVRLPLP